MSPHPPPPPRDPQLQQAGGGSSLKYNEQTGRRPIKEGMEGKKKGERIIRLIGKKTI
jgi:hypothetical protein